MKKRSDSSRRTILWIDDDIFAIQSLILPFYIQGYKVLTAKTGDEALNRLEECRGNIDLVILDVRLPPGNTLSSETTRGGFHTGIVLGSLIRKEYPQIPLLGFSVSGDEEIINWFRNQGQSYIQKRADITPDDFFRQVESILRGVQGATRKPKVFIVHGHDEVSKLNLKNYLQNRLHLGEPIVLHEQPNLGRTIIEKFEEETADIDIVFVLLTPDDVVAEPSWGNKEKRRARQNVIFELGYFYGKVRRRSGKVILCYKGNLEIPSDISGITYIDMSNGIESSGEQIRLELRDWLVKE